MKLTQEAIELLKELYQRSSNDCAYWKEMDDLEGIEKTIANIFPEDAKEIIENPIESGI